MFFQVHGDGLITLGKDSFPHAALRHRKFPFPPKMPSIAVFYTPVEVKNFSEVFYRETRNQSVVKWATDLVRSSFVKEKDFGATYVFIATWNNVIHADDKFHYKVIKEEDQKRPVPVITSKTQKPKVEVSQTEVVFGTGVCMY